MKSTLSNTQTYLKDNTPLVIIDNVINALQKIPSKTISVVVTSPPYWNLRDYNNSNQIGNEPTPQLYVDKIALVGSHILRVLKDDGVYFLNLGDTYVNKSLQMIPQKIAIEMQSQGWLIRNQIIWYKPNHMPSPVKNRFSNTYEVIFFFSKNDWEKKVNFNLDAVRIPHKSNFIEQTPKGDYLGKFKWETKNVGASPAGRLASNDEKYTVKRKIESTQKEISLFLRNALNNNNLGINDLIKKLGTDKYKHKAGHWFRNDAGGSYPTKEDWIKLKNILQFEDKFDKQMTTEYRELQKVKNHPKGKNPGDLFVSNTAKNKDKHFAVFPESIPKLAIKSCCPKDGIVLDPFAGSGTTGLVAKSLNRKSILIDIQKDYLNLMDKKIKGIRVL